MARSAKPINLPETAEKLNLSEQQKKIVHLIVSRRMNARQVADTLGLSPATVTKQIRRILQKHEAFVKSQSQGPKKDTLGVDKEASGVNSCPKQPTKEELENRFATRVAQVIYLKNHLKYSYSQIANLLQISEGSVKRILSQARHQRVKRDTADPTELKRKYYSFRSPKKDLQEAKEAARLYYRHFVTEENVAPTREVYRSLAVQGYGGSPARRILFADRAMILKVLAESSRTNILHIPEEDAETRRMCKQVLENYFTQIAPGYWKPCHEHAWHVLRETLAASSPF